MEETKKEKFAVDVIHEARKRAMFWFSAWLVTFGALAAVVATVLVM